MTVTYTDRPYDITFEHRPAYLYVSIKATEISYEIAKRYWTEIMTLHNARQYSRVLIDREIKQRLGTQDTFRVVTEIAFMVRPGMKFAFVDRNVAAEESEFEEMVGSNRGLNLKYFHTLPSAEQWLAN